MKSRLITLFAVLITVSIFIPSCKKGENDPGMSLLSRKARLTGEWNLTSGNWTNASTNSSNDKYSYIYEYAGTFLKTTESITFHGGATFADTYSQTYSEKLNILSDFTFTYAEVFNNDDGSIDSVINSGSWYFLDRVKAEEIKNKERVEFLLTSKRDVTVKKDGTVTIKNYTYAGHSNNNIMIISLDKLANKEIIVLFDNTNTSGTSSDTKTGTKTYTQVK